MLRASIVFFGLASAAIALGVGCNAVLGFDEAKHDPALDGAGDGGSDGGFPFDLTDISCDHYCTVVMTNCTGDNVEYLSRDVCMQMCGAMELGQSGMQVMEGDTVACRQYHASVAPSQPKVHCRHAGPSGNGVCGAQPCEDFCRLDRNLCDTRAYPDIPACVAICEGKADAGPGYPYDPAPDGGSEISPQTGNTLNCRLYHLEAATQAGNANSVHCPHTALVSDTCQ